MKPVLKVVLVFALASCVTTKTEGTGRPVHSKRGAASEFYPLEIGTSWQYEQRFLGEKRTLEVSLVKRDGPAVVDSTGNQLMSDSYGVRDAKRYLLRDPIEVGTKWSNVVSPSSVETYEIIGVDLPCEVPAGSYSGCVIVRARNRIKNDEYLTMETTFAPKVGIVRLETVLESKGNRIPQTELALVKFTGPPVGGTP